MNSCIIEVTMFERLKFRLQQEPGKTKATPACAGVAFRKNQLITMLILVDVARSHLAHIYT